MARNKVLDVRKEINKMHGSTEGQYPALYEEQHGEQD